MFDSTIRIPGTQYCDFIASTAFLWKLNLKTSCKNPAKVSFGKMSVLVPVSLDSVTFDGNSSESRAMSMSLRKVLRTILKTLSRTHIETNITKEPVKMRRLLLVKWWGPRAQPLPTFVLAELERWVSSVWLSHTFGLVFISRVWNAPLPCLSQTSPDLVETERFILCFACCLESSHHR